jgi:hypothetical protein
MSYFPISWPGNKRQELDKVMPHINLNDYDVIVEPFGGSAAFSLAAFCGGAKEKHYVVGAIRTRSCFGSMKRCGSAEWQSYRVGAKKEQTRRGGLKSNRWTNKTRCGGFIAKK